jgi:hypothetical protein
MTRLQMGFQVRIAMNIPFVMHWMVASKYKYDETCECFTNEIDEIMSNTKFQIQFDSGPKDNNTKEFLDRPFIPNEITK